MGAAAAAAAAAEADAASAPWLPPPPALAQPSLAPPPELPAAPPSRCASLVGQAAVLPEKPRMMASAVAALYSLCTKASAVTWPEGCVRASEGAT